MTDENKSDEKKYSEELDEEIRRQMHERMGGRRQRHSGRPGVHPSMLFVGLGGRGRQISGRPGVLPGLLLMVFGTVILLDHMGFLEANRLWSFWPLILILAGAVKFFRECNRVVGTILMLIGGVLLFNNLGITHFSWNDVWPFALIAVGATLIWSRFELPHQAPPSPGGPNSINEFAMFGGVDKRVNMSSFQGGSATALFGGVKLDFRSADIEGESAVMYLEAVFGGIELIVPERWSVQFEGQNIFGGYTDETRPPVPDAMGTAPKKQLILRGRAMFGGVVVKN